MPQRASRNDASRTPSRSSPHRPLRVKFDMKTQLGAYARELDMYCNYLERNAAKEVKNKVAEIKMELQKEVR